MLSGDVNGFYDVIKLLLSPLEHCLFFSRDLLSFVALYPEVEPEHAAQGRVSHDLGEGERGSVNEGDNLGPEMGKVAGF